MQRRLRIDLLALLALGLGVLVASRVLAQVAPADTLSPRIGSITIEGNRRTRNYVIERELLCRVGDSARALDCELMKTRLDNIHLFSEIDVVVDSTSTPGTTHLRVQVRERLSLIPFPIASNSTKNGVTLGAGCHFLNFRGRNERLSLSATGGGVQGFSLSYGNPWMKWNHFSLGISTGYRLAKNNFDHFTEETFSVGSGVGIYLSANERWRSSLGASYVSLISDEEGKTVDPDNHDHIHGLGVGLTYDSRLLYRNPRSAWRASAGVSWFGGSLGGTVGYTQYLVDVRRFIAVPFTGLPLPYELGRFLPLPFGRTLALRARLTRRAGQVPDYRLVRIGGSSSMRGYDGGDLEGSHGALAGVEYRFDLVEPRSFDLGRLRNVDLGLSAALFYDAGLTWDEDPTLRWDHVEFSYGGGLRLFAPWVEVVRFDLAVTRSGHVEIEVGEGMIF